MNIIDFLSKTQVFEEKYILFKIFDILSTIFSVCQILIWGWSMVWKPRIRVLLLLRDIHNIVFIHPGLIPPVYMGDMRYIHLILSPVYMGDTGYIHSDPFLVYMGDTDRIQKSWSYLRYMGDTGYIHPNPISGIWEIQYSSILIPYLTYMGDTDVFHINNVSPFLFPSAIHPSFFFLF